MTQPTLSSLIMSSHHSCLLLLQLDCEKLDVQKMWGRVSAFASGPASARVPYKLVVLDGADNITPTSQQLFKKVYADTEKKTKYIFICRSLSKMTGHVVAKGPHYSTHLGVERDALGKQQGGTEIEGQREGQREGGSEIGR